MTPTAAERAAMFGRPGANLAMARSGRAARWQTDLSSSEQNQPRSKKKKVGSLGQIGPPSARSSRWWPCLAAPGQIQS